MSCRLLATVVLLLPGGLHPRLAPIAGAVEPLPPGAVMRLGDTRFRAGGPVEQLEFSADGRQLTAWAAGRRDAWLRTVWDTTAWEPVRSRADIQTVGAVVRWQPTSIGDTTRGVVIGADGVAVVRDFATKKDLARLTGHFARITAVTVSPDGKRIATASADGLVRVWDAETFRPVVEPKGHTGEVRAVEVSPDGRLALTTGADRTARVWDLATGRELRAFAASGEARAAFTADGAAVCIPQTERMMVRDLVTGLEVTSPVMRRAEPLPLVNWLLRQAGVCVALSPDGRTVAVGGRDGVVRLYESATGQLRHWLPGHAGVCLDVTYTPDGGKLLTAGADHCVLVWSARLRDVSLPEELKRETSAAKLWDAMNRGPADEAYRAMARLAADPGAAVKMARLRLKPDPSGEVVADVRAVELLEAIGTEDAKGLLRELAAGDAEWVRTREAVAALKRYNPGGRQINRESKP